MMPVGFWLGVATPFAVLILFGVTRLLLRAMSGDVGADAPAEPEGPRPVHAQVRVL